MGFFGKMLTVGLIGYGVSKIKEGLEDAADEADRNRRIQEAEIAQMEAEHERTQAESARKRAVEKHRQETPVFFNDGISCEEFTNLAHGIAEKIPRIVDVKIQNATVLCTVESQRALSSWEFSVDFNDWGHITGTYWHHTDNSDSSISKHFADAMQAEIQRLLDEQSICLENFSDAVDNNAMLETENALNDYPPPKALKKLLKKSREIVCHYNPTSLLGNHLYPVISFLKQNGFQNIKTIPIKDVCRDSSLFLFQVEQVLINGSSFFEKGNVFNAYTEVLITYHVQQEILIPFSPKHFIKRDYVEVGDELVLMGFSNIYERAIKDLAKKWSRKNGNVIQLLINDNVFSEKNSVYKFDDEIVIEYHSY